MRSMCSAQRQVELRRLVNQLPGKANSRAAKLSLLNFFSLFRDLQKPTTFGGGGGGSSTIFPSSPKAVGGGSSRNFPWSPEAKSNVYSTLSATHLGKYDNNKDFLRKNNRSVKFTQFREIFYTIP